MLEDNYAYGCAVNDPLFFLGLGSFVPTAENAAQANLLYHSHVYLSFRLHDSDRHHGVVDDVAVVYGCSTHVDAVGA